MRGGKLSQRIPGIGRPSRASGPRMSLAWVIGEWDEAVGLCQLAERPTAGDFADMIGEPTLSPFLIRKADPPLRFRVETGG